MKACLAHLALLAAPAVLGGCSDDGAGQPGDASVPDGPVIDGPADAAGCTIVPLECQSACISPTPVETFADCCDSVTCYCHANTGMWDVVLCDPPPPVDAGVSRARTGAYRQP